MISIFNPNSPIKEQVYYLNCPKIKLAVYPPEKEFGKYTVVTRIYINKTQYDEHDIGKYDKDEAYKLKNKIEDDILESSSSKHTFIIHQQKEEK